MPVVDASVLVEYLAGGEHADQARARLVTSQTAMWAPHLVDAEAGHVLRRAVLAEQIGPSAARAALADLADLPLRRAAHTGLLERAWALRSNLSFYDALYVRWPSGSSCRFSPSTRAWPPRPAYARRSSCWAD